MDTLHRFFEGGATCSHQRHIYRVRNGCGCLLSDCRKGEKAASFLLRRRFAWM